jgi:DHA2 family multidrug resistance protein-like MFS transporter
VWLVCFVGGATLGPLVGGVMLEHFWWGSAFLLGVPAMVLLLVAGPLLLPEYKDPGAGRLDLVSVGLSLAAILPLIYGLKTAAKDGLEPHVLASFVVGAAFAVVFVRRQTTLADPLIDLRLLRSTAFSAALVTMLMGTMLLGTSMVFVTQYLQLVADLSPLKAGLWMLPGMAASVATFLLTPLLARRVAPATLVGGGLGLSVLGLLLLTQADAVSGLGLVVTSFAVISLGAGPMVVLSTDLVVGSAPPEKAGSAASMSETAGELGFAVGIAVLGTVGTAVYRARVDDSLPAGLPSDADAGARDTLAAAVNAAESLPAELAEALLLATRTAFVDGMHAVSLLSAVLMTVVAVVASRLLRDVRPSGHTETGSDDAAEDESALVG